jgi:hypothetical protein
MRARYGSCIQSGGVPFAVRTGPFGPSRLGRCEGASIVADPVL